MKETTMNKCLHIVVALLCACVLVLSSCNSPLGQDVSIVVATTSITLSYDIPQGADMMASAASESSFSSGARILDPNTAFIQLGLKGTPSGKLSLGDGTRNGSLWTGTFGAVPAGSYAPGEIVVSLLSVSGSLLAVGSNGEQVTVSRNTSTSVAITAKPADSIVTDISYNARIDMDIPAGGSRYYRIKNFTNGDSLAPTIYHPTGSATMVLLDGDGALFSASQNISTVQINGRDTDWSRTGWYPQVDPSGEDIYIGIISTAMDGAAFKAEAYVFDKEPSFVVSYSGRDLNQAPDDYGYRVIADGSTIDAVVAPNLYKTYEFMMLNGSSQSRAVTFPTAQPVTISTSDPRVTLEWQEDFGTGLWGGSSARFGITIRTDDIDGDVTDYDIAADGATGSVLVTIPNDVDSGGPFTFTLKYTVASGTPRMAMVYSNTVLASGSVIDLGDVPASGEWAVPLHLFNNSKGRLTISDIVFTQSDQIGEPFSPQNLPEFDSEDSFTVYPYNNYYNIILLTLNELPIGQSGSMSLNCKTNDPLQPDYSLTLTYRVGVPPPDNFYLKPGATDSKTGIDASWDWNSSIDIDDVDHFRLYRSDKFGGPFIQIATIPVNELAEAPYTHTYSDTGLKQDSKFYYKVDAVFKTSEAIYATAVCTAKTWYARGLSTFDPAKMDAMFVGKLTSFNSPCAISFGDTLNPRIYPIGIWQVFSFVPTQNQEYIIKVSNLSLGGGMDFTLDYLADDVREYTGVSHYVDPWGSTTNSYSWTCPGDEGTIEKACIIVRPYDQTSGSYSINVEEAGT